ncbi:MAG: hypothetical protein L3J28_06250 [Candidatus Polarisedimenticolaceae bacterium]|nr:hypothetical protein [Candidatus Polarisedimenticolaceae bacterium]
MKSSPTLAVQDQTEQPRHRPSVQIPANSDDLFKLAISTRALQKKMQQLLAPQEHKAGPVIWQDGESEVIVHLDKLRLAIKPGLVLFEIQLEADNLGLVPMVVPFRIGNDIKSASLTITTEHLPRGDSLMTHRWGEIVQEHLWFALLEAGEQIKQEQFTESTIQISGLYSDGEQISYIYSEPVTTDEIKHYVAAIENGDIPSLADAPPPTPIDLDPPPKPPEKEPSPSFFMALWLKFLAFICQLFSFLKK